MSALVRDRPWASVKLQLHGGLALGGAACAAVATLVQALWLEAWNGPWTTAYPLMLVLIVLGAVACHFPVELTPRFKAHPANAVYFAMLLLFPPPVAVALVGLAALLGNGTLAMRRSRDGRPKRTAYDAILNASQWMIATALAALVLYGFRQTMSVQFQPRDVLAVPLAAGSMYIVNTGLVALMVGLHTGRNPIDVWYASQRLDPASEAALYLIGLITALGADAHPWVTVAMVVPAAVVYMSTKRAISLSQQTIQAVEALADMVDMRDPYTAEHSKRVAANVARIASCMGLKSDEVATLWLAARVHDLGKLLLPDSVLRKEGRLTPEEFAVMKEHPRHGYEILAKFPQYRKGREIVLAHHERVDGKGYPRGLGANRIPIGAQIVAVADALDAMTSDRPYRAALPLHQAMTELRLGRGAQWSAAVVDAAEKLLYADQPVLTFGKSVSLLQPELTA